MLSELSQSEGEALLDGTEEEVMDVPISKQKRSTVA